GITVASPSSFHGPGQPRTSTSSAPPLETLSRFTPLTVNQAYAQRVPKHRSPIGSPLARFEAIPGPGAAVPSCARLTWRLCLLPTLNLALDGAKDRCAAGASK